MAESKRESYRALVRMMGKKEATLLKMQEYGFWPDGLPTPYEKQKNETPEQFAERENLLAQYKEIINEIAGVYSKKQALQRDFEKLKKELGNIWDYETIKKDVSKKMMDESLKKRKERKDAREKAKQEKFKAWEKTKKENIVFIGKGYSGLLNDKENNIERLNSLGLPIINDDKELAKLLGIEYQQLRGLAYHRDVIKYDPYFRYSVPKRKGGERNIAAPNKILKQAQRKILEEILQKIEVSENAHGFISQKSIVTGAKMHKTSPALLINIDLENFFPTITFKRIAGLFKSLGYSGYIASIIAMLCTYCERVPVEIKGETRFVKTSDRILPQGSPASPMITNIICRNLDTKMIELGEKEGFTYSRYADDMSFSFENETESEKIKRVLNEIKYIVSFNNFKINSKKTRFLRKNNRQVITGILVNNEEIGVPKVWVKRFRAIIHQAGIAKQRNELSKEKRYEISGMISYLNSVNPEKYEKIINDALNVLN